MTEADALGQDLATFLDGRASAELARVVTALAAAAIPTARQLGTRTQNSVGGTRVNQPCISR